MSLQGPPPLTHQDGLPPLSALQATLSRTPYHTTDSCKGGQRAEPSTSSSPLRSAIRSVSSLEAPLPKNRVAAPISISDRRVSALTWSDADVREGRGLKTAAAAAAPDASLASTLSSASSSATADPATHAWLTDDGAIDVSHHTYPAHGVSPHRLSAREKSAAAVAASTNVSGMVTVPIPALVEQQRRRIRELVHDRDKLAEELQSLRDLLRKLSDDYEHAVEESEERQRTLDRLQAQHAVREAELQEARAAAEALQQRIVAFEEEWATRTSHLKDQLEALSEEREAVQSQRDSCMSDLANARQELLALQKRQYDTDLRHQQALREQAEAHAQTLRVALQEKEEQQHTRAAATRHEARLTQQQMTHLGAQHAATQEDNETLQWRIQELETVIARREHLRSELERMVTALRAQVVEHEQQSRMDAQRYSQRVQELEQTSQAQAHQEQQRCRTLQDELASARRALQEAHRQSESQAEAHALHTREAAARAVRQEEDLREQLRQTRVSLTAATTLATQHEAAALRWQREVESLRSAAASHQEQQVHLHEAQTAQAQQLLRAEGKVEVLQTRLRQKEREAEVLRCTIEQTVWTREAKEAMQHSLAVLLGLPRAAAVKWLQGISASGVAAGVAPLLEGPPVAAAEAPPQPPNATATASPPTPQTEKVLRDSPPQQQQRQQHGNVEEEMGESDSAAGSHAFHSPVRDAAASTRGAAGQHVLTIERTVARNGSDRQASSPFSGSGGFLHGHTAPPLYPGSGHSATAAAAPRVTHVSTATSSPLVSAALPLLSRSFTSVHASSPLRLPSQPQHQYNVVGGEGEGGDRRSAQADNGAAVAAAVGKNVEEEVFFDDFQTPTARRGGGLRPLAWSTTSHPPTMTAPPPPPPPQGAVQSPQGADRQHQQQQQTHSHSVEAAQGVLPSPPLQQRVQAADLLSQLHRCTSSVASTPPFSASARVVRSQHHLKGREDPMGEDADGLQQYLRETVQQVLAAQPVRQMVAQTSTSGQQQQRQALGGHSHHTQLFDGSPLRSVMGEEDFGSASRPRSVLSVLPWQQRTPKPTAAVAASTAAAAPGAGDGEATRVAQRTPTQSKASATRSTHSHTSRTAGGERRSIDAGVANTLEQLARRQKRLLQSLAQESGTAFVGIEDELRAQQQQQHHSSHVSASSWPSAASHLHGVEAQVEEVDVTGSEPLLDPRQLSYATATTLSTATESNVHAEGGWVQRTPVMERRAETTAARRTPASSAKAAAVHHSTDAASTPPSAAALPTSMSHADGPLAASQLSRKAGEATVAQQGRTSSSSQPAAETGGSTTVEAVAEERRLAATGTSVLTSVSDVSSLTQLERRFAQPFPR